MHERIFEFLAKSDKAISADRILLEVLKLESPNCLAAHKVLKGILAKDRRFHHTRTGLWWVSRRGPDEQIKDLDLAAVLFLEGTRTPERFVRGALYVPQTGTLKEFTLSGLVNSTDRHLLRLARDEAELHLLFTWSPADLRLWNWLLRHEQLREWAGQTLYLGALAARVLPSLPERLRPADLASRLDLSPPDQEQPTAMARYLGSCLVQLMQRVPEGCRTGAELQQWIAAGEPKVDFSRFSFGPDFLRSLPESSGVYVMRGSGGAAIYVGKARNLRRRVRSYFTARAARNRKVARLHEQLYSLEYLATSSEVDALLLEVRLIRDLRPAINLQVEVHERPEYYGKTRNLILLVRNQKNGQAQLYFLREGSFVARVGARPGKKLTKRVRERVRSVYFTASSGEAQGREPWEMEIVSTWLRSEWRRLNLLDIDEAGSYDTVLKRLEEFLRDPDLFKDKVFHR
jgi:predicted GIY-YIG superfamily endonuclease